MPGSNGHAPDIDDLIARAAVLVATCSSYDESEGPKTLASAVHDLCVITAEMIDAIRLTRGS